MAYQPVALKSIVYAWGVAIDSLIGWFDITTNNSAISHILTYFIL